MAEPTLGEWIKVEHRVGTELEILIAVPHYCVIADVLVEHGEEDEARANAAIMAASKNLLAACERAEQTLRNLAADVSGDTRTIVLNEAANLRSAVARARGEGAA